MYPTQIGLSLVSLLVALGIDVGMKWASHSFFEGTVTLLMSETPPIAF
jgi:hypothetical protein